MKANGMRTADGWTDYELIDCSDGERLERWGDIILVRPDPQVVWKTPKENPLWRSPHAIYKRSSSGGGSWKFYRKTPDVWQIGCGGLKFNVRTMGFKHTGVFPEQEVNWRATADMIKNAGGRARVLNLFAYTGGATVSALRAGAAVTHVDASRGAVSLAKENAAANGLSGFPVRWIVDDCIKFVKRELRRGSKYDMIIMDPPSYGRGPGGEVWKLEDEVYGLTELCSGLLSEKPLMALINSYTTGLSPSVMEYILGETIQNRFGGSTSSSEIGLRVSSKPGRVLPCGASAFWTGDGVKSGA